MDSIEACGIIICALIVCIVFKSLKNEYSLLVRITITIIIFSSSLAILQPLLTYIEEIAQNTAVYQYLPILFKALSISFAVQITADICRDANEGTLAERITLFGKIEILLVSLPLVKNLFSLTEALLK